MWPVSEAFRQAVRRSGQPTFRGLLESPAGLTVDVEVIGGTVTVERARTVRRTCEVDLLDRHGTLQPDSPTHPLHPIAGWRLRLWSGMVLTDGQVEEVPVGVYRLSRPTLTETADGVTVQVSGRDLAYVMSRARLRQDTTVSGPIVDIIQERVTQVMPSAEMYLSGLEYTVLSQTFEAQSDGWDPYRRLGESAGRDLAWGPDGVLRAYPAAPEGMEVDLTGVVVEAARDLDDDPTRNVIVVKGEHPDLEDPIVVEVADEDPTSPLWIDGPYGEVSGFYTSSMIATVEQAHAAGVAELERRRHVVETYELSAVPDPSVDVGDLIAADRLGASGVATVERVELPLSVDGTMRLGASRRLGL